MKRLKLWQWYYTILVVGAYFICLFYRFHCTVLFCTYLSMPFIMVMCMSVWLAYLVRDMFDVLIFFVLAIAYSIEYCVNQALNICFLNLILLYFTENIIYFRNGNYNFRHYWLGHILPSCISKICKGMLRI